VGYWNSVEEINDLWQAENYFHPNEDDEKLTEMINNWNKALEKAKNWINN
jgi:glycerol kinase